MRKSSTVLILGTVLAFGCAGEDGEVMDMPSCDDGQCDVGATGALCTAEIKGSGTVDVEADYLPNVVACENGNASFEALKAQAIAARSYVTYIARVERRSLSNSEKDQVAGCGRTPSADHIRAVRETAGQILTHDDRYIAAFYVAGATQSPPGCSGSTSASTERYVTYNEGLSGDDVEKSSLGSRRSPANRGCMSQNGADCLSDSGRDHREILRFYYGADIEISQLRGECVDGGGIDPRPSDTFIGSPCVGGAGICDFVADGEVGHCLEWIDEDNGETEGLCTISCSGLCPDAPGFAVTICADVNYTEGQCVPTASPLNNHCDDIPGAKIKVVRRYMSSNTEVQTVCAPPYTDGISCTAGGTTGECIDTDLVDCGGQIHTGACPGASNIRCCTQ